MYAVRSHQYWYRYGTVLTKEKKVSTISFFPFVTTVPVPGTGTPTATGAGAGAGTGTVPAQAYFAKLVFR